MFGALGNLGSLLKQAQQMEGRLASMTAELRAKRAVGQAGGGLVEVEVNGLQEVLQCRIDPGLFAQQDRELAEDLIRAASNDALLKARQLHAEAMQGLAGGISLPGLEQVLGKLSGGFPGPSDIPGGGTPAGNP